MKKIENHNRDHGISGSGVQSREDNDSKNKDSFIFTEQLRKKVVDHKSGKLIENPYKKWSQISPVLPDREIMIYGPPLTSGTRDVFVDIVTENFCFMKKEFIDAFPDDHLRRQQCRTFRSDGKFLESGENDNLIIQKLKKDPNAFGIFGFDFLIANKDAIQAVKIDNVEPNFSSISSKKYKLSRPLFVYFKKENLKLMPQMHGFIEEIISVDTIGRNGYLLNSGLIALSKNRIPKSENRNCLITVDADNFQ